MIDFLAGNWGNVASVAGLFFSILAFVFSKRASKAALEARNATLLRSLSEDMNGANRAAGEIVTYVGMARGDMALLRTSELMNQTSYFLARWDNRLTEEPKNNLLSAREQLRLIHKVLTKGTIAELSPKAKAELVQACQPSFDAGINANDLRELYVTARRQALQVDDKIDQVLGELSKL